MSTEDGSIRVLLVDDQDLVRTGFRVILSSSPSIEVIGEAANGGEAVTMASQLHPDVICMDVQMPGMDGLTATRMITADPATNSAVLILTTFDRDDYLFEALHAGASGFLLKNATPEQLVDAITVLASGEALLSPTVTRRVIETFTGKGTESSVSEEEKNAALRDLTPREIEVLRWVAQGLSNAEIAAALFLGEATVKTHVSKILQKLALRDRIQAVVYAYEHHIAIRRT